jgi:hypothetical protein
MEVHILPCHGLAALEVDVREGSAWETHRRMVMMGTFMMGTFITSTHPKKMHGQLNGLELPTKRFPVFYLLQIPVCLSKPTQIHVVNFEWLL